MKPTIVQRLDTETRKIQIKKAVLDIISHEGLAKLSTRNLAANVGVSEGTIYRHFKNKKNIMFSIIDDVERNLLKTQKAIAYSNVSAINKLNNFLCIHVRYLVENNGITILLFSEAAYLNETELKGRLNGIMLKQKNYLTKILNDGIDKKLWDENIQVENFAALYLGIPLSLNVEIILNPGEFSHEKFCENMIGLLIRILKKR